MIVVTYPHYILSHNAESKNIGPFSFSGGRSLVKAFAVSFFVMCKAVSLSKISLFWLTLQKRVNFFVEAVSLFVCARCSCLLLNFCWYTIPNDVMQTTICC